ncbi:MAG: hypothetical protein QNJ98_18450 [Planctomycetota bacterium]|nr:hypothetical protein [Planctomycetota bacterium]
MPLRRLLPLLLVALIAGVILGIGADRLLDRRGAGGRADRPAELEQAWRALERGDAAALGERLKTLDPAAMPSAAYADEVRLLMAVHAGDRAAVRTLADEGKGRTLGAQALAWLIDTAPNADERRQLEAALAERYPDSWRVPRPKAGPR